MRRTKLTILCLMLLAALLLVATGCGSSSKNSAATTEEATTEVATTTEAATTEAATTEAATTEATTTSALGGLVASGKCKDLANLGQKYSQALNAGGAGTADLKKTAQILQEFADKAPSEVKSDFQVVADYMSKVADVAGNLKPGQTPDPATLAKLQKLATSIDSQKLTAASQHISAWVAKNCHG
ncbi:MAG TPA: hypothetical protein VH816_06135 [Gaiellaceae bacterium]|jgi:hypothetical protein